MGVIYTNIMYIDKILYTFPITCEVTVFLVATSLLRFHAVLGFEMAVLNFSYFI